MNNEPQRQDLIRRQEQRLMSLESHATHLQRDLETINEVVLEQGRKLDQVHELLNRLTRQVDLVRARVPEPPDERPPHY